MKQKPQLRPMTNILMAKQPSNRRNWVTLTVAIVVCLLAGAIGSFFTTPAIPTWYATLVKPSFSPPNWLFAPVWTTLYILMGIAVWLIWESRENKGARRLGIKLFAAQLVLNALWSILFFGLKNPLLALVDLIALWIVIVMTMKAFYQISRSASYLLVPYICWISFAGILNAAIVLLN